MNINSLKFFIVVIFVLAFILRCDGEETSDWHQAAKLISNSENVFFGDMIYTPSDNESSKKSMIRIRVKDVFKGGLFSGTILQYDLNVNSTFAKFSLHRWFQVIFCSNNLKDTPELLFSPVDDDNSIEQIKFVRSLFIRQINFTDNQISELIKQIKNPNIKKRDE